MPVRLRGHHFLCLLTYRGRGYTPAFVENMSRVAARIAGGAPVFLAEGPDDICGGFTPACRAACDHDCNARETAVMDRLAAEAVGGHLKRPLDTPQPLGASEIALLRQVFKAGAIRAACAGCSWKEFCDSVAAENFSAALL